MISSLPLAHLLRFIIFVLVQVLVLKNIGIPMLEVLLYPLFVIMLPFRTPHWLLLLIAFFTGIIIDAFYSSLGIHTSALVFMAFLRHYLSIGMAPRGGYDASETPTKLRMGIAWWSQYVGILMFIHILAYLLVLDRFEISFMLILRILYAYIMSMLLAVMYSYLLNPRE